MRGRTGRAAAVLGVLVGLLAATASCSFVGQECAGFAIDFALDAHGQDSPEAAAAAISDQGTASLPRSGWRQVGTDEVGVRLRSGRATAHALRLADGSWAVDSGTTC
jgi:hypothetical protein